MGCIWSLDFAHPCSRQSSVIKCWRGGGLYNVDIAVTFATAVERHSVVSRAGMESSLQWSMSLRAVEWRVVWRSRCTQLSTVIQHLPVTAIYFTVIRQPLKPFKNADWLTDWRIDWFQTTVQSFIKIEWDMRQESSQTDRRDRCEWFYHIPCYSIAMSQTIIHFNSLLFERWNKS